MIRFNIAFSLVVKALFLILAVLGMTSLWLAILADTGATLLVVMNALRLLRPTMMPSTSTRSDSSWCRHLKSKRIESLVIVAETRTH